MEQAKQPMMRHRKITLERLEKFVSDTYFKDVNIKGKIFPIVSKESVTFQVYHAPGRISYNGMVLYVEWICFFNQ